jgi:hypothetical protein
VLRLPFSISRGKEKSPMYDPNFVEKLRKLSAKRNLSQREVRAFIKGDSRLLSADELRSISAQGKKTSEKEKLKHNERTGNTRKD